ncbi:MAG: GTP 3',8-cyclase MoaA [Candidatus Omnitrophica bacterium]|nr:GTP 3',8-cyclase MoaA [Candidatus Omnitrophota bacterium]
MLSDEFGRKIEYLRVSVTDRCNLRCIYCMPADGIAQKLPEEILTFEEIVALVKIAISLGIDKIKITGGEPLLRRDISKLFSLLSSIKGIKDLSLTTNGIRLKRYVKELKIFGLKKINISLDTLNPERFKFISRQGLIEDVLEGIEVSLREGFFVKLNVVVLRGINDDEISDFIRFADEKNLVVRFIELMPMGCSEKIYKDLFVSSGEVKEVITRMFGLLKPLGTNLGNGPAEYFRIGDTMLIVGFISSMSHKFCLHCNRLRLTADGLLMPCLTSRIGIDIKRPLRENKEAEVLACFKKAIYSKPESHQLDFSSVCPRLMAQIGG